MLVTRQEIVNEVLTRLGTTSDVIDDTDLTSIQLRVNQIQDLIFFDRDWEWRKRTYQFTTRAKYATGTLTATQNSKTLIGSGTTWETTMRTGYVVINGYAYKIQSIDSTTQITLESQYPNTTTAALTYAIIFPDYRMPHEVSSIIAVRLEGKDLELVGKDQLARNIDSYSEPMQASFGDRAREDYYNAGTVTVVENSATVTGSSTAFESLMEGMSFRVNDFSKMYVIKSVDSTTQITLRDVYEGSSASGKSYKIAPAGTPLLTLRNPPDDYYYIEVDALIEPDKLVSDTAYSLIPNHAPLLHGAIWLALTDFKGDNPVRIQQARADFERTLDQLRSSYGIISNVKWRRNETGYWRKNGTTSFNPLGD